MATDDSLYANLTSRLLKNFSGNGSVGDARVFECMLRAAAAGGGDYYDYSGEDEGTLDDFYGCLDEAVIDCNSTASVHTNLPGYTLCIHVLLPIISILDIVGITVTVVVLSRKHMWTSTNSYLISLAAVDLCFLLVLVTKCFETRLSREQYYMYAVVMTYSHVLLDAFLLASVWLTVMLAVERYIAICHPLRAYVLCSVARARAIIIVILLLALALRAPNFFKFKISSFTDPCLGKEVVLHALTSLGEDEEFHQVYSWTVNCVLCAILPFSVLLFLNGCLIREIHRSTKYLRYHLASNSKAQTILTSEEIKITLMLISVVLVFFLCQAPYVVLAAVKSVHQHELFPHYHVLTYVTILLLVLRSSCNVVLYCWFSEKFWITFRRTFCVSACMMIVTPRWRTRVTGIITDHDNSNGHPPEEMVITGSRTDNGRTVHAAEDTNSLPV